MTTRERAIINHFIDAAQLNRVLADEMLLIHPWLIDARHMWGGTLLHFCVIENLFSAVQFLQSRGFSVNEPNKYGDRPLADAVKLEHSALVEFLIASGADVNVRDSMGEPALMCALRKGKTSIAESLLNAGALPDTWDILGRDLVAMVREHEFPDGSVQLLLSRHLLPEGF